MTSVVTAVITAATSRWFPRHTSIETISPDRPGDPSEYEHEQKHLGHRPDNNDRYLGAGGEGVRTELPVRVAHHQPEPMGYAHEPGVPRSGMNVGERLADQSQHDPHHDNQNHGQNPSRTRHFSRTSIESILGKRA
ncbi:MAG TPA: hypothetical protein VMU70_01810 [Candidatus Tyrphobacter sp.]|nr:hypothetical protein [Candidatus Tyrphobacter sp.]